MLLTLTCLLAAQALILVLALLAMAHMLTLSNDPVDEWTDGWNAYAETHGAPEQIITCDFSLN